MFKNIPYFQNLFKSAFYEENSTQIPHNVISICNITYLILFWKKNNKHVSFEYACGPRHHSSCEVWKTTFRSRFLASTNWALGMNSSHSLKRAALPPPQSLRIVNLLLLINKTLLKWIVKEHENYFCCYFYKLILYCS